MPEMWRERKMPYKKKEEEEKEQSGGDRIPSSVHFYNHATLTDIQTRTKIHIVFVIVLRISYVLSRSIVCEN